MEKLIRDGQVAVLYSPGFGAGWSTWMDGRESAPRAVFDPVIAQMVLDGKHADEIQKVAEERYPDEYVGGVDQLEVFWVTQGTEFWVKEYDGSESLQFKEDTPWFTA